MAEAEKEFCYKPAFVTAVVPSFLALPSPSPLLPLPCFQIFAAKICQHLAAGSCLQLARCWDKVVVVCFPFLCFPFLLFPPSSSLLLPFLTLESGTSPGSNLICKGKGARRNGCPFTSSSLPSVSPSDFSIAYSPVCLSYRTHTSHC